MLLAVATAQFSQSFLYLAMLQLPGLAETFLQANIHSCESRSQRMVPIHGGVEFSMQLNGFTSKAERWDKKWITSMSDS
jgi:hypothetical protein